MDLDDEELKATRKLNRVDKESSIEEDIKMMYHIIEFYKRLDTMHGNDKCKEIKAVENILLERKQDKKRIKKLEEENKRKDMFVEMAKEVIENSILKQKVKDLKESIILEPTIVGGRRNAKTLEYGIKLGKIKACEELLEDK